MSLGYLAQLHSISQAKPGDDSSVSLRQPTLLGTPPSTPHSTAQRAKIALISMHQCIHLPEYKGAHKQLPTVPCRMKETYPKSPSVRNGGYLPTTLFSHCCILWFAVSLLSSSCYYCRKHHSLLLSVTQTLLRDLTTRTEMPAWCAFGQLLSVC